MNTRTRITIVVIFGALAGVAFFYLIPRSFVDPTNWPSTTGTVVQTAISSGGRDRDRRASRDFDLRVTYTYVVAGVRLENNSRSLLSDSVATSFRRERLERLRESEYAVGRSLRVYYDPKNPKRAVLDTTPEGWGVRTLSIVTGIAGCLGVIAGLFGKAVPVRKG